MTSRNSQDYAEIGVGGLNQRALDQSLKSPAQALSSILEWRSGSASHAAFPFRPVIEHFQAAGRTNADKELVKTLRALAEVMCYNENSTGSLILSSWLPSTFDQDDGDYDSYVALPVLSRLADASADGPDITLDVEQVAVQADLLLYEATALARRIGSPEQEARTWACARSLLRTADLAPRAAGVFSATSSGADEPGADEPGTGWSADRAIALALLALDAVPLAVRQAVEITVLPTTPLHDEVMFIRSIQAFELVYQQVARCLARAVAAVEAEDAAGATAEVRDAQARVVATRTLYRVLTTMPRDSFAVIRSYTQGRSAIQSRSYWTIQRLAAPLPPDCDPAETGASPIRSLQEAYLEAGGHARLPGLAQAMSELDEAWRAMKRTHWGITLKVIGRVPGTGGTAGADYLKESATRRLFPQLHARSGLA